MFATRLFLKTKLYTNPSSFRILNSFKPLIARPFATNIKGLDSQTIVEDEHYYTPSKTIDLETGKFLVFDNKDVKRSQYIAPYEVKETMVKNSIGVIVSFVVESNLIPLYYIPSAYFALNMVYRVCQYMTRAVDQMTLLS